MGAWLFRKYHVICNRKTSHPSKNGISNITAVDRSDVSSFFATLQS